MNFEHSEQIISNSASLVLKNSSILVFYLSQEGKFVYANEKFIEEIGLSQAELYKVSIFDVSPHLTSSVWMMMISSNIDVNYTLTFAIRSMNGKVIPLETTIQSIIVSEERLICCLARDISNQKKLEELLSVQNTLLDSISRLNRIGTWEYNIQQSTMNWSHEMYAIHDVSASYNPSFEKMLQFFQKESRANLLFLFKQLMNGSIKNISIEIPLISELGKEVWIMLNASAEKTPAKTIFKIYGTYQDITDKIEDNIKFASLYDRYLRATKAARTGIFEFNIETEEMYWDTTMFTLYEVEEQSFSKSNFEWKNQVYSEDQDRISTILFSAIDNKAQVYEEFRIATKSTPLKWIRIIGEARYNNEGKATHFIGVNIDINEQKKKDVEIDHSKEFFQSVFSSVDQAIFVIEKREDGKIIYIDSNPAHERLSGIKKTQLIGKSPNEISSLLTEQVSNILQTKYTECFEKKEVIEYEENLEVNGIKSWWFTRLTPIVNERNEVFRVVASSIDTTKLKEKEGEILQKNKMFSSIASLQQEFISTRFSLKSLHTILLDCLNNTSSTFGFIAEVVENQESPDIPFQNIVILSALIIKSTGKIHLLIKEEYPISLQEDTLFSATNLENYFYKNDKGSSLTNSGFPPSFPIISSYVIKPLKFNDKLNGFLLLANSSIQYNKEICEEIKPLTTTVETIFAGFRIMKKEHFISTIFNEIIVTSFKLSGKEFFEKITSSLTTKLQIDNSCIFKKVGSKFHLVVSNLRGNENSFEVSQSMNEFFFQLNNVQELFEHNIIPIILQQDSYIKSNGFQYFIATNIVNENGNTIGLICIFSRKVFQYTESIISTLSVLSTKVTIELEKSQ